jgi:hypothetical protein
MGARLLPAAILTLSPGLKPEPLTFSLVPGGPLDLSRLTCDPRTRKAEGALLRVVEAP